MKFNIVFDVGRDGVNTPLFSYLKKAQIDLKHDFATMSFGLIGMNTYDTQEKNWGYRFIEKSVIDKYKFSSTADVGMGLSKSVNDIYLSLQLVNGEGFKSGQKDEYHKVAFNITYGQRNINSKDGYNAGFAYTSESTDTTANEMTSIFSGFSKDGFRIGIEYNILTKGDVDTKLISISTNYDFNEKLDLFIRYDNYNYEVPEIVVDERTYVITGVVLNCGSGLSIAPNIRKINESYKNTETDNKNAETEYKVNFQFKF